MFRDRTNLYLSYRRTFPHNPRPSMTRFRDEQDKTVDFDVDSEAYPMVDMESTKRNTLPPGFIDVAQDIDEYLDSARSHMNKLHKLYQKNSLPGFEDKTHDEKVIEDLSYQVIQLFQKCYNTMKKLKRVYDDQYLDNKRLNKGELAILDNVQKCYADKIQVASNKFRMLQNNYLKFLNKDDLKPISSTFKNNKSSNDAALLEEMEVGGINAREQQEIEDYSRKTLQKQKTSNGSESFLRERDEEITQLAQGVLEVSTIFREMQNLIIDQGTIVDRIDYNLENTVIELKSAHKQLNQATRYQKRTQKCKVILLLTLCVIALFFFVMLKPHGSARVVHDVEQVPARPHAPKLDDFHAPTDEEIL